MEAVISALVGAAISAFVAYGIFLRQQNADIRRRLSEIKLREIDSDIRDFYGPLHSITQQIFRTREIQRKLLKSKKLTQPKKDLMNQFFLEKYFWPLHLEMQMIIRSRYHLAERLGFDTKLKEYLHHSIQTTAQISLFIERDVETDDIKGIPWPTRYGKTIERLLKEGLSEREKLLNEIHQSKVMKKFDNLLAVIGVISFIGSIIIGLLGQKIASIVMVSLAIIIWLFWVTKEVLALRDDINNMRPFRKENHDTEWHPTDFRNDWENYQLGRHNPTGFFKDSIGIVHLRGLVCNSRVETETDNIPIFFLPRGYRPEHDEVHVVQASYKVGRVDVRTDGSVVKVSGRTGDKKNNWISLDGITFKANH